MQLVQQLEKLESFSAFLPSCMDCIVARSPLFVTVPMRVRDGKPKVSEKSGDEQS